MTTRASPAGVLGAEHAITRAEALRLYTVAGARFLGGQATGTLVPGAPGDLVAYREDPFTCPDDRLLYAAILEATLAELAEAGYSRLAMERVAAPAGASKASLYRRWPSRAELVVAALRHHYRGPETIPDTGNLRDDVLALLRLGATRLNGVFGEAARGLMAESLTDPDRTASVRANMFTTRNRLMGEILDRAAPAVTSLPPRSPRSSSSWPPRWSTTISSCTAPPSLTRCSPASSITSCSRCSPPQPPDQAQTPPRQRPGALAANPRAPLDTAFRLPAKKCHFPIFGLATT